MTSPTHLKYNNLLYGTLEKKKKKILELVIFCHINITRLNKNVSQL